MNPSSGPSKERFDKERFAQLILNEKESDKEKDHTFIEMFIQAQLFQVLCTLCLGESPLLYNEYAFCVSVSSTSDSMPLST